MKVTGSFNVNPGQLYQAQQKKAKEAKTQNNPSTDKVEISPEAQKLKEMVKKTISLPDIRKEQVEQLKKEVDSGSYNISAEQIAKSMLDNI